MPIDSRIALGITPPHINMPDPMEQYGRSLALKNLMGQGDLQALKMQEAQRGVADQDAVRSAYQQAGGDNARLRALLQASGQVGALQALDKADLEKRKAEAGIAKDNAATGKSDWEVRRERLQHGSSILATAKDQASYDNAIRIGLITGTFGQEAVDKFPKEYSPQAVEALRNAGLTEAQRLEAENRAGTLAQTVARDTATDARGVAANQTSAGHLAVSQGQLGVARGNAAETARRNAALETQAASAQTAGRIPPGYRQTPTGDLEPIPGGPAAVKVDKKDDETGRAINAYVEARNGLMAGLSGTYTGALAGRIPAATTGQQIAEGGVAAMAPVLKSIFRTAGEGTFTDRDQAMLLDMVPKRTDSPEAAAAKMANIDRIVAAKMGLPIPPLPKRQETANDIHTQAEAILRGTGAR